MRLVGVVLFLALLSGCSTALDREGRCLAGMMPEVLRADDEVRSLDESWRRFSRVRQAEYLASVQAAHGSPSPPPSLFVSTTDQMPSPPRTVLSLLRAEQNEQDAYARLVEAKARRHVTFAWYDRVAHRFRTRVEEDEMLSDARSVLMTWPGILFYPIVRWNIRSVLWDGDDPDAESDPVTHFCEGRLQALEAALLPVD